MTKITKKTTKKIINKDVVEFDYKEMYESMKVLCDNQKKDLEFEIELRSDANRNVWKLKEQLDDAKYLHFVWMLCGVLAGLLFGYFF